MALDSTKINKSKKSKDDYIEVYLKKGEKKGEQVPILRSQFNAKIHDLAAPEETPGNLNKAELALIADANPTKSGKTKSASHTALASGAWSNTRRSRLNQTMITLGFMTGY